MSGRSELANGVQIGTSEKDHVSEAVAPENTSKEVGSGVQNPSAEALAQIPAICPAPPSKARALKTPLQKEALEAAFRGLILPPPPFPPYSLFSLKTPQHNHTLTK